MTPIALNPHHLARGAPKPEPLQARKLMLELYTPHEGQQAVHACPARFRVVCCGRRWGKSYLGVNELAKYSWENIEYPGWWVAPTYNQAVKGFTVCTSRFADAIESKKAAQGQMSIVWKSGGVTRFVSAERYENLRGEGVGLMVLDEAAFMSRAAWEQVLRPMLTDTMGGALFTTTPRGKNWLYGLYRRGLDPTQADYASFSFPASTSPYIADSEVEEARMTLPADVFAQEYLAEFLDEAAGVFHGIEACVFGGFYEPDSTKHLGHRYCIGWDIAKHTDFSVVTVMDMDESREGVITPHVCHFDRFNTLRYDMQMDHVATISQRYGGAPVLLDSSGLGDPIYDTLAARGVPVYPYTLSGPRKMQLIQNLAIAIQTKAISFPDIPVLRHELSSYQYTISPSGSFTYSAPEGEHDDTVISLGLATWAAQHPAWNPPTKFTLEETDPYEDMISPI